MSKLEPVTKKCQVCGEAFADYSQSQHRLYCSEPCREEGVSSVKKKYRQKIAGGITTTCSCGELYVPVEAGQPCSRCEVEARKRATDRSEKEKRIA